MAIFGQKPWVNPFGKMSIFRLFQLLVFIAQKGVFSFQHIVKDLPGLYCLKKQCLKNGNFWTKANVNPCGKMSIFRLSELFVFIAQKNKVVKMAISGPRTWVNPFGKMSIFRLFQLRFFIAQKAVFSFQNMVKDIFLAYIELKKKLENWPFLDKTMG